MGKKINFIVLALIVIFCAYTATNYQELSSEIDKGDTAWMLVASAFVLLMTPFIFRQLTEVVFDVAQKLRVCIPFRHVCRCFGIS